MAGVKQARDGAVGILTLDEPASLNAMTPHLLGALAPAVAEVTRDDDIRALLLNTRTYEAQSRREIELQAKIRNSADAIEGRNALVEKRKAKFTGR